MYRYLFLLIHLVLDYSLVSLSPADVISVVPFQAVAAEVEAPVVWALEATVVFGRRR